MAKLARDEGGGKRTEVVTVRFDPRLKYLAELAARKQRRPLSSFIEWAVDQTVSQIALTQNYDGNDLTVTEADKSFRLWDPDEADRVVRLAFKLPELLTHEEQVLWKLIRRTGYFWEGNFVGDPPRWDWEVELATIRWGRLKEQWELLREVAAGKKPASDLPSPPESQQSKS